MYRLISLAVALLLILPACASPERSSTPEPQGSQSSLIEAGQKVEPRESGQPREVIPESEVGRLDNVTPVSAEFARRMRMPDTSVLEELDFPLDDELGKLPSATGTDSLLGRLSIQTSQTGATNSGDAKRLTSSTGTAWVMYQFPGYDFHKDPGTITVKTSDEDFGGSDPGYILAIANYRTGRWQMLGQAQSTGMYIRSLNLPDDHRSVNNNVYIAVVLPQGQKMDVDQVELTYNDVDWLNVEIDSLAGWTPSVEFLPNGNILIAYADILGGQPLAAILDRSLDPSVPDNWSFGTFNENGKGVGLGQDIVIGPAGTPRISLAYTAIGSFDVNTLIGFTAYYDEGAGHEAGFYNYEVGQIGAGNGAWFDLANSSSIDYNSESGTYGFAVDFYDLERPDNENGACRYRQFTLNESVPPETISTAGGLTTPGYWHPRVGFAPGDSRLYFANNGGYLTQESAPNMIVDVFAEENSHDVGDLGINPNAAAQDETFGFIFKYLEDGIDGPERLRYIPLLANLNLQGGGIQTVDNNTANAQDFLADFNRIDFHPDGRPAIAYTDDDGSSIRIMYASWSGSEWVSEQVSAQAISKYTSTLRIWLDLAIDDNGIAGITWNRALGISDNRLMFAIRGS